MTAAADRPEADRPEAPSDRLPYRRGVGIVLINRAGSVFVGRRLDTPDAWQMPQGGIDPGETPADAARRELLEETHVRSTRLLAETRDWLCYDLPPTLAGRVWGGRYRGQAQKWLAFRFLGSDQEIDLTAHKPEFDAWRWADPAELVPGIVGFKRAVYSQVLEIFADLLRPVP